MASLWVFNHKRKKNLYSIGYRSHNVGRTQLYTLINQFREHGTVSLICTLFSLGLSGFYYPQQRRKQPEAERMQLRAKPQNILFHSDQGSQYAPHKYRQYLWRYRMPQRMSRQGNCWYSPQKEHLFISLIYINRYPGSGIETLAGIKTKKS